MEKTFDAKAAKVFPGTTVQHFIAKGEVKISETETKTFYFQIVMGDFQNKNGERLYVRNCFLIDPSDTPVKCSIAKDKTNCTPDAEFISLSTVNVTLTDDKKHPKLVEIQKTETGTLYRMNVATKSQITTKKK